MFRYTQMMGLLDGNPPWSSQKLIEIGQGHRANFNLRESEGIVEAAKTPYYDLVFEVPQFARIEFDTAGAQSYIVDQWNDIISAEYTDILSDWDGFDTQVQLHQWQMVVNGVGPLFWPHYIGWHSEATKARKVLVPMETKANVNELELAVVLHSYRADELDSFLGKGGTDDPAGEGWNRPLCRQAIIQSSMREMRSTWGMENYDLYQRAIRTGDLFHGIHRSDRIYVASLFVKEFGGRVSHYIITDQPLGTVKEVFDNLGDETGYLFHRKNKYSSFMEVLCPFFFDSGPDGTWHSVKGLGPKIYDYCDVSNRTFCQMLDGAVIGSGITLETQDSNSLEESQLSLVGGGTVVAPGYKVVQTRIAESLQGALAVRSELHSTLEANTAVYRQRTDEAKPEPTLGQAQLLFQQQGTLTKGATNRYYNNLDKFHYETLRRLLDPAQNPSVPGGMEAMQFKARCIVAGIPPGVLDFRNIKRVIATRSLGYGSPQLRDQATQQLVGLIPFMDEVSRNHALRARVASLPGVGMHSVDSFFPPIEKTGVPNAHAAFATVENNALRQQGGKALVEPQQNHSIHFDVHMQDVMQHLQDQSPAPDKLVHMENAGPHMTQHLQLLQGDPTRKDEVKQKQKQLDMIGKISDKLHQNVTEAMGAMADQQQNGNGQQAPPDPAMVKVQGDLALKAQKQQADFGLKVRKQQHSEDLQDKKTASSIQRETVKTRTGIQREDAKTGTHIRREAVKAATSIRQAAQKTRSAIENQNASTDAAIENQRKKAEAQAKQKKTE